MRRDNSIDIAKGIGILAVVLGHNWLLREKGELFRIIFSFHMPLFFFVSGVFLKAETPLWHFLTSRASSLLKPYFVVLGTLGAVHLIKEWERNSEIRIKIIEYLFGLFYGVGSTLEWVSCWFLPHLFVTSLFTWLIINFLPCKRGVVKGSIALVLLTTGWRNLDAFSTVGPFSLGNWSFPEAVGLPWSTDLVIITSPFILLGHLSRNSVRTMQFDGAYFAFSLALFAGLHYFFDETIDFNNRIYGNFIVVTIQALTGIHIALNLGLLLKESSHLGRVLAYLGSGSLYILMFHGVLQAKSFWIMHWYLPNEYICGIFSLLIGTIMPMLSFYISNRSRLLGLVAFPLFLTKYY